MSYYGYDAEFIDFLLCSIFLLVEIWLDVLVMMFLSSKYTKLNVLLICVAKSRTTSKMKRREY